MNRVIIKANDKVKAADDPEKYAQGIRLMKIILSPAKKMITDTDSIAPDGLPEFIEKRRQRYKVGLKEVSQRRTEDYLEM